MNQSADARPDLSALSREVRVRIAVAVTQGWTYTGQSGFDFHAPIGRPPRRIRHLVVTDSRGIATLPNYLTDPAAWGALLEKELCGIHQSGPGGPWKGQWWDEAKLAVLIADGVPLSQARALVGLHVGPILPTLPEAVCAAVLAKHGIDWDTLEPVT